MSDDFWHEGELAVQNRTGVLEAVRAANHGRLLRKFDRATEQLETFFQELSCVAIASLDENGRVWASFVTGAPGFISFAPSTSGRPMSINTTLNPVDPLRRNLQQGRRISWPATKDNRTSSDEVVPLGFVGVMFHNRRRNRFNGIVRNPGSATENLDLEVEIEVVQQFGNCPKYIHMRSLKPIDLPDAQFLRSTTPHQPLAQAAKNLIFASDTLFIASRHVDTDLGTAKAGLDCNHRGGPKGWARLEKDGLSLVIPDYSGNRFFQTLGNIALENQAGATLVHDQSLLYLTGTATTYHGDAARAIMPRSDRLTVLKIESWILAENVVPFEWSDINDGASPYNPRLKYLAWEEDVGESGQGVEVILRKVERISKDVKTFSFELEKPMMFRAGQHAVMDLSAQLPPRQYQHMNQDDPTALNEDGVRSWTISNWAEAMDNTLEPSTNPNEFWIASFDLTIKDMRSDTRKSVSLSGLLHERADEFIASEEKLRLLGFGGRFGVDELLAMPTQSSKIFFVAGGIGITPFDALLSGLASRSWRLPTFTRSFDIIFVVFTQNDDFSSILENIFVAQKHSRHVNLQIHSFATRLSPASIGTTQRNYTLHAGPTTIDAKLMEALGYEEGMICLGCGPPRMMDALAGATGGKAVHVEEFTY